MRRKLLCTTNPALILAASILFVAAGCGQRFSSDNTPDDEAMKRLRWENEHFKAQKTPEQAAREYFLPKYYYDPSQPEGKGVADYFPGMDRIVVRPDWQPDPKSGPPLEVPVFQLLDQVPASGLPEYRVETAPLRTNREILGRNTWMLWCGGNEGFWDWLSSDSLGFIDLLKLVDSRMRRQRFDKGGLINEPGMMQTGGPDQFGLWLDIPADGRTREWRNRYLEKTFDLIRQGNHPSQRGLGSNRDASYAGGGYPSSYERSGGDAYAQREARGGYDTGVKDDDERNRAYPPPEIYGFSSGVIGLRLFPNPNFDAQARKKWDAARYYDSKDPDYWNDPHLVRPYRVGVACAYCHASFHPLNPPRDIHNPRWENISGNIGAQYLRIRVAFGNLLEPDNFVYHILDSQPPGTIDTSLIVSDNINNPNTMNSVFNLPQRALLSLRNPKESITASSATQPSLWNFERGDPVPQAYVDLLQAQGLLDDALQSNGHPPRRVPRILLDGSDSIGAWGALARVYLNIGTYWEQWERLHRTVVGFEPQRPFTIADCERHSLYWHATQDRVAALRDYFLKVSPSMPLLATEDAGRRLEPIDVARLRERAAAEKQDVSRLLASAKARHVDVHKLERGREIFARNCIACHSSIQPENSAVTFYRTQAERDAYNKPFQRLIAKRREYRANDARTGEFWEHDPAHWLGDADYIAWARDAVERPDFWRLNYLSSDYRVPINLVNTNAGRAMATNALDGNMWDDFASESYQRMPSVGAIDYFNPYQGADGGMDVFMPRHRVRNQAQPGGGGPGFYRVPTLVSIWATAPLLHNNSLGTFNNDPSVDGRLETFDDAIRKLLWPERRLESSSYNEATPERLRRDHGLIWRTPQETYLRISGRRVPTLLGGEVAAVMRISDKYPWLRAIRPLWLPSGILLLASFFLLVLGSQKQRVLAGAASLVLSLVTFLLWWCCRNAPWLNWVYPLWLVSGLLLGVGLLFLAIDCPQRLRYLAYAALVVGVIGFILSLLGDQWPWLRNLNQIGPTAWLAGLCALGVVFLLLGLAERWRRLLGWILVVVAAIGLLVYLYEAKVGGPTMSASIGPVWLYLLLIVAAALVLLTPDRRELTCYVGYASLVLSLALGGLVYFFAGQLGDIHLGPIPQGTPVNLLANLNPDAKPAELRKAVKLTVGTLAEIESKHLDAEQGQALLRGKAAPALMEVNKCPDFVMDHGHYFAWFDQMTDDDKDALIELLKTF
jgi:hypothetical protein